MTAVEIGAQHIDQGRFVNSWMPWRRLRAWSTAPSTVMASGFKVVQERAIQFAKENAEAGFALASELAQAKDLQDVLRMQSSFAQKQMASYAKQAQELGRLMAEATRSGEPKG